MLMTDQNTPVQTSSDPTPTVPVTPSSSPKSPLEMFQDIKDSFADSTKSVLGDGTVDNLKHTATQVAGTV